LNHYHCCAYNIFADITVCCKLAILEDFLGTNICNCNAQYSYQQLEEWYKSVECFADFTSL